MRPLLLSCLVLGAACADAPPPLVAPPPPPPPSASAAPAAYSPPIHVTPDAPFRQSPPPGGPPVTFVPPKITELHLKNGVRVLLVERHELPIVSVRVVTKNGAGDLPWLPAGVATLVGSMLERGTATRTALQISDAYEALGAEHGAWADFDYAAASVKVTSERLDAALDLLSDVVLHPSFPAEELERVRARRLAQIQQEAEDPHLVAWNSTVAALYGRGHAYGHTLNGSTAEITRATPVDMVRVHAVLFNPARAAIVVAGDITSSVAAAKLEKAFGSWRAITAPPLATGALMVVVPRPPPPAGKDEPRLVVIDRPNAPQSAVWLAEVGVAKGAPDRDAISVMNAILGGMFSSRINLNLREAHAYTYGATSYFDRRHGAGPFVAGGNVKADTTGASIAELFKEDRAIQDALVTPDELRGAKESLELALPADFETVEGLTSALNEIVSDNLPLDEFATRPARIEKVTAEDVQKAAKAHLHPHSVKVIVVGDKAKIGALLEPLHLGPIQARDAYGDLLKPAAPAPAAPP